MDGQLWILVEHVTTIRFKIHTMISKGNVATLHFARNTTIFYNPYIPEVVYYPTFPFDMYVRASVRPWIPDCKHQSISVFFKKFHVHIHNRRLGMHINLV